MGNIARTLIAEAEPMRASALSEALQARDVRVRVVESAAAALELLGEQPFDVVLVALGLPDGSGLEVLEQTRRRWPDVRVILQAPEVESADVVRAMRAGALDVLTGPVDEAAVATAFDGAVDEARADPDPEPAGSVRKMLGESRAMQQVNDLIRRAAPGTATVLIRGESGTGKELAARAIHAASPRLGGPFVKIHCAALPDTLLESELFGYEKGAFTGATQKKLGRVELAQGGTLFLDEIGDITPALQVKLLRLLQDKEFERLGGGRPLAADVRFVAATHRDLDAMVKRGELREDLFYRLNVVTLWLPPLRARRDDVTLLARHFCATLAEQNGKRGLLLEEDALDHLRKQRWPGNVRQLQNFLERLVVLSEGGRIRLADVQRELAGSVQFSTQATGAATLVSVSRSLLPEDPVVPLSEEIRNAERAALSRALEHTKGNRTLAARLLGVSRATLYNKLEEHGLS
ncbi:MAG: sigma-54 dependent transcriptional regulator [Polyangiaceae bacterium]